MPEIIFQSSRLSSVLPKKNPTAHSKGVSSDTAIASAITFFDCKTQEPTGRTQKVRRDNKKRTSTNRSSLVIDKIVSRFYSPLYEHWDVIPLVLITTEQSMHWLR